MTPEELEKRQYRAENETLIISKTEEGFRVHRPSMPHRSYVVSGTGSAPSCTCPDFQKHSNDSEWRCKHVLAVFNRLDERGDEDVTHSSNGPRATRNEAPLRESVEAPHTNGMAQMLIKRSVSPDGRIDSLSVEFSCSVDKHSVQDVDVRAQNILQLQQAVVERFLNGNNRKTDQPSPVAEDADGAVPAEMLSIGGTDGKWGRRLFISVQVNGRALWLFGSEKQLGEHLTAAGYPEHAVNVHEGAALNLPCRVVTEPSQDGRFLNVAQVLPPHLGR